MLPRGVRRQQIAELIVAEMAYDVLTYGTPVRKAGQMSNCRTTRKSKTWQIARPLVAVVLMILLFRLVPLRKTLQTIGNVRVGLLAFAATIPFAGIVVSSLKLKLLIISCNVQIPLAKVIRAYYVGSFFNHFLPTSIGGDLCKGAQIRACGVPMPQVIASVTMERLTGVLAVLLLSSAVAAAWPSLLVTLGIGITRVPMVCVGPAATCAAMLLPFVWHHCKDRSRLAKSAFFCKHVRPIAEAVASLTARPAVFLTALCISCVFYVLLAVMLLVAVATVRAPISPLVAACLTPLAKIPEFLPVSIGALGVREATMTYCLTKVGTQPASAMAAVLLMRLINWGHSLAGGLLYAAARTPDAISSRQDKYTGGGIVR